MLRLLTETAADAPEVEALYDLAFAPGRGALSAYTLREGVAPVAELCRIARDEYDAVVAAIRYWPVRIGGAGHAALLLGPIAVHPTRQGEGLGRLLIEETLGEAGRHGWARVILVGDEPYYRRFGFRRDLATKLDFPKPVNLARLLVRPLYPDAMDGISGAVRRWETASDAD
ncbi:MAG: GNAT family N-acetyltransferase [Paracoccaceae bacterium]